jgi:hypothetical protein
MARQSKKNRGSPITRAPGRRSSSPPLWDRAWPWYSLVGVLVAFPLIRDMTADPMQRAVFRNEASCRCAYPQATCTRDDRGNWVGPWYARDAKDRRPDDPGRGQYCYHGGGYHGGYFSGGASGGASTASTNPDVSPAARVESGYRGGFGGSGRVRAAGS